MNVYRNDIEAQEKQIESLTRSLMHDAFEQPRLSLNARIMARIMKEKRRIYKQYVRKLPSPATILGGVAVYIMITAGICYLLFTQPETQSLANGCLKKYFPFLLTTLVCIAFFFFFAQLDHWLYKKEKRKTS